MAVSVSLPSSRAYQREAIILFGGGALSGLVAFVVAQVAGAPHVELMALSFGAVIGLFANLADAKEGTPMLRLVLSIVGGVVMALLWSVHPVVAGAGGGAFIGASASLGEGQTRVEKVWNCLLYTIALSLAVFVTERLGPAMFSASEFGRDLLQGSVWGVFLAFSAGLRRLEFLRDEIRAEFTEAEAEIGGRDRENVVAGRVLYERIVREVDRADSVIRDRSLSIATETSRALIAFAKRADELRQAAEVTSGRKLKMRLLEVNQRIESSRDPQVRSELTAVMEELHEQLKVRARLDVARARLEAKQQRCLTSLERLHVTLLQGAGTADSSLEESIESLQKLSDELHWQNLSVDELVKGSELPPEITIDELLTEFQDESEQVVLSSAATSLDIEEHADEPQSADKEDGTDGTVKVDEETHVQNSSR